MFRFLKGEIMKTRAEIEALKFQWTEDPCWDLEETDGFENHREELREYRQDVERRQASALLTRRTRRAKELGVSLELAIYIETLEARLEKLERA